MATTVKSSASSTVIALLSTINSGATSIAKIIDSGSSSVDMLDRYVQRAKTRQHDSHLVEDAHWRTNLLLDAAKSQAKREETIKRELAGNGSA